MTTVRQALGLAATQRLLAFAINLVTTMTIARLITPAESGIYSLAVGLVAIVQMFRDFGVGEYLVQAQELTEKTIRSAFGMSLLLAWTLGGLLLAAAIPAAHFYKEPVVANVVRILSINFFLVPFGYITHALLTREMRFGTMLIIQTSSAAVGSVAAILLAWRGFGAIGLAWSLVAAMVANTLMLLAVRPASVAFRPDFSAWRKIGGFGIYKTSGMLLEQLARRTPDFALSRSLGFAASGLYSRANGLADTFGDFVVGTVYRVALPQFAKIKNEGGPLGPTYIETYRMFACIPLSFFSFMALYSEPVINVLFGHQWLSAAPAMSLIAIAGLLSTPVMLAAPALTGTGSIDKLFRAQLIANPVQILAISFAAAFSIEAVALCMCGMSLLRVALYHQQIKRAHKVPLSAVLSALVPSLTVVACSLVAPVLFLAWSRSHNIPALVTATAGGTIFVSGWLASLYALKHPYRAELGRMYRQLRSGRA
ncbi:oligosaccharide flippase family protein [Niveibacterium microcysteis]|uniref:Oligosaccharide flippase family protein n=1 Tax=Niveibacterium microcysteis TaxID=2811415 RepID=A0ABX7MEB9_9RHOO|nr:oligosaccharide flippase family protein [Niveibacterium microcysteis]QSI78152.1 oligosaccharide flippase family protein [Niveibacterium microcysteis]